MKIRKGDNVTVLKGRDNGKTGTVERVLPKVGKVYVSGVNMSKRHVRRMGEYEGGVIDIVKPLPVENVALVCPACKKPTRIGYKIEGATKVRICRKCQKEIKSQ